MGFWNIIKESIQEANENTVTECTTFCQRCGRSCKHYLKGLNLSFRPIIGSLQICSKCNAKKQFDGNHWHWIN